MAEYRLVFDSDVVVRNADETYIPNDPSNRDRQAYEAWLEQGNTPDPAVNQG